MGRDPPPVVGGRSKEKKGVFFKIFMFHSKSCKRRPEDLGQLQVTDFL